MFIKSRLSNGTAGTVWLTAAVAIALALASVLGVFGLRASLGRAVGIPVMLGALFALATSAIVLYAAIGELLRRAAGSLAKAPAESAPDRPNSMATTNAGTLLPLAAAGVVLAIVPSTIVGDTGTDPVTLAVALPVAYLLATALVVARRNHRSIVDVAMSCGTGRALAVGLATRGREFTIATGIAAFGAIVSASPAADFAAWERVPLVCYAAAIGLAAGSIAGYETARRSVRHEAMP